MGTLARLRAEVLARVPIYAVKVSGSAKNASATHSFNVALSSDSIVNGNPQR